MTGEAQRNEPKAPLGRVIVKALTSTLNMSVAGSAAVGAAALQSWPVLALGGVAYAALVAWDMASPAFWKKAMSPAPLKMPDPSDLTDHAARAAVISIRAAEKELEKVLAETPDEVKGHMGGALASVEELKERTIRLVRRADDLSRFLATKDPSAVRAGIDRMAALAARSRDKQAKAEYERARAVHEEQHRTLEDIANSKDRVTANLSRIVATLEGLPAKIVRMRALDAQAMDELSGNMNSELERVNGDIQTFEETLKSLVEIAQS